MRSNHSTNRPLRSGELARLAGVSADTLRYYERAQLLPAAPRSSSGYRLFPPEALLRVRLIRSALSVGFSVKELSGILRERDSGGAPCRRVRKLVAQKMSLIEARLADLQSLRGQLRNALSHWDRALAKTPRNEQARLLERFALAQNERNPRHAKFGGFAHRNSKRERQQ